ncbi:heterokaryon incompatibility protein-domain-containing protein [Cubamyces menziesii]|nr:heterokaryon incompatibility protein-domain-containing protein [Cubamyces menziesii]
MRLVKDFRRKGASKFEKNWWPTCRILRIRIGRTEAEWSMRIVVNDISVGIHAYAVSTTPDDPAARYIPRRPRLLDVKSHCTLAMAKACIEQCAREHERCRLPAVAPRVRPLHLPGSTQSDSDRNARAGPLETRQISTEPRDHVNTSEPPSPTRLIDCRDPRRPRIIYTRGTFCTYVALSYVWGGSQPHRTTVACLSSYMTDGIDPTMLPQTIRDAIHVTHRLGIDFLWTDSLCIIQDSPQDKHRELVSMCEVYRYAYLTIDAASAEKASDGFLQDRSPLRPDLTLPFICPRGPANQLVELGSIMVHFRHGWRYEDVMTDNVHAASNHTGRRAWCLQETLLSTRSLVFTEWTIQLRCQTSTQNIGGAIHYGAHDIPRLPGLVFHPDRRTERYSDEWIDIRQQWHNVVEDYSRRLLSYSSDILAACAGLAQAFAQGLGSDYVAGMWNDDLLIDDLLWSCEWPTRARPTPSLAPSWSWASLLDPVGPGVAYYPLRASNKKRPAQAVATVISCTTTAQADASPLLAEGKLVLRAPMFACETEPSQGSSRDQVSLVRGSIRVQLDSQFDCDEDTCEDGLWAVLLQRKGGPHTYMGLLLVPHAKLEISEGSESGLGRNMGTKAFRRVGYFETALKDRERLERDGKWEPFWSGITDHPMELTLV